MDTERIENLTGKAKLLASLNALLAEHAKTRVNGNVASGKTTKTVGQVLRTCFSNLWDLNYRITSPANLTDTHIKALCDSWHKNGIANTTMQSRLSYLRIMNGWIGNGKRVKSVYEYMPEIPKKELRPVKKAMTSKSWTENQIDVAEKIREADAIDTRFGMMLRLELAFGLRRMEVLHLRPNKSDMANRVRIYEAKNGRMRDIDIVTPEQRAVVDMAKMMCRSKDSAMGWERTVRGKASSVEYNERHYNTCMRKIGITRKDAGVTGHGLRAQFAENTAVLWQVIPPTLGGSGGQMEKEDLNILRAQVSEQLGHSRIGVTAAYYGSFGRNVAPDDQNRSKTNIENALNLLEVKPVLPERRMDCHKLVGEMLELGIDASPSQMQSLWEIHSERFAVDWKAIQETNIAAVETAALNLLKQAALHCE